MTPLQLHRLAPLLDEYNAGIERARRSYQAMPIATGRPGCGPNLCEWGDCTRRARALGLCENHYRKSRRQRGKARAA